MAKSSKPITAFATRENAKKTSDSSVPRAGLAGVPSRLHREARYQCGIVEVKVDVKGDHWASVYLPEFSRYVAKPLSPTVTPRDEVFSSCVEIAD